MHVQLGYCSQGEKNKICLTSFLHAKNRIYLESCTKRIHSLNAFDSICSAPSEALPSPFRVHIFGSHTCLCNLLQFFLSFTQAFYERMSEWVSKRVLMNRFHNFGCLTFLMILTFCWGEKRRKCLVMTEYHIFFTRHCNSLERPRAATFNEFIVHFSHYVTF